MSSELIDLDVERNRRLDPAMVAKDAAGRELTQFVASYEVADGQRQMIGFWAYSRQDAQARLVAMRRSLRFEGVPADFDVTGIEPR